MSSLAVVHMFRTIFFFFFRPNQWNCDRLKFCSFYFFCCAVYCLSLFWFMFDWGKLFESIVRPPGLWCLLLLNSHYNLHFFSALFFLIKLSPDFLQFCYLWVDFLFSADNTRLMLLNSLSDLEFFFVCSTRKTKAILRGWITSMFYIVPCLHENEKKKIKSWYWFCKFLGQNK